MLISKEICNSKLVKNIFVVLFMFSVSSCSNSSKNDGTSTYEFITDKSKVVESGGFAGINKTYPIKGSFKLSENYDTNTASFEIVDANLLDSTSFLPTQNLNELFNMTSLKGTITNKTTIVFEGKTSEPQSDISITLTKTDGTVSIKGNTTPPPGSADFFIFNLDAIAKKK